MDWLDAFQRRFRVTAFAFAVQKKFSEDRGGYLAALITYYGLVSLFPLLLAAFTIVAYALSGDQSSINALEKHIGGYPIIGPAAKQLHGTLKGSPVALVVGVLGLVWGSMGLAQAAQHAMNEAWNVAQRDRRGFLARLLRGVGWYALFGTGVVASTLVTSLGPLLDWSGGPALSALIALVINIAVFTASFHILSPAEAGWRQLLPGSMFAGTAWTVLTGIGVGLTPKLAHSNELYGTFAPLLALLAFIYLTARLTIYGVEANVVRAQHLWPRSLTNKVLEPADEAQLVSLARRAERVEGQRNSVEVYLPNNSDDMAPASSTDEPTKTASLPELAGGITAGPASSPTTKTTA